MRTKQTCKRIRTLRRRRLALALVTAMAAPMALAQSLPSSSDVVSGTATIGQTGNEMTVTQTTKGAIIDWGSFNIGSGYGVTFDQQFGASSVTLNRVVGFGYSGSASFIDGTLSSNGNVFIINPSGIVFGSGAQVNVGGLVASTLWMTDAQFTTGLATGNYVFDGFNGDTSTTHEVRNNGNITAGAGGVGFVGSTLWNRGSITSNGGNIGFGAGTTVTLDYFGDGLTQVTINVPPTEDSSIVQDRFGTMTADGGKILLRTAAGAGGTGGGIFVSGSLRAQTIANVNGRIELTSAGGPVMLGAPGIFSDAGSPFTYGSIDVSGSAGETGGSVLISGNGVILINDDDTPAAPSDPASIGSSIDATGVAGGGSITIASTGDINALELTRIDASGVGPGNGGTITLSANGGNANLFGNLLASSGKAGGNGGVVSISARDSILQDHGTIRATGANDGGDIGLIASTGDIYAVDLDASGYADGGAITASAGDGIYLYGNVDAHGQNGNGGTIGFTADGKFRAYGDLAASGRVNGGDVSISSAYVGNDGNAITMNGTIDVSGYSGNGGSAILSGNGYVRVEGEIYAGGGTNGGTIGLYSTAASYGGISVEGTLDASGTNGNGGIIDIDALGDVYVIDMLAWGGVDGGDISVTGAAVDFSSAIAYGTAGKGGSVSVTADNISLVYSGNSIDVQGDTGGGSIDLYARDSFVLGENSSLSADTGSSGNGGSIHLYAGNSLVVYGDLSAHGVDGGGSIYTGSGGGIDLNGIGIDAGTTTGNAGAWTIAAPQMTVVNGASQGIVDSGPIPATTTNIQDADLNNAFANGTSIVLQATSGSVQFDAAQILSAFSSPLFLHVNATDAIFGSGFSIGSSGGPLEMLFNADAAGGNDNGGYIDFSNATLASNGGLIAMYGQSDPTGGFATGYANGISLAGVVIDSGGGNVVLRGYSTGSDAGPADAGVFLDASTIDSGGGNIDVQGTGLGDTSGVIANNSSFASGLGSLSIIGIAGGTGDGIRLQDTNASTNGGDLALTGTGGGYGVYALSSLSSGGGDIRVHGEGGTEAGTELFGGVHSAGGNIDIYGVSTDATGLVFFSGLFDGISSAGGEIRLEGNGVTGGTALFGNGYGGNSIDGAGGPITIIGSASGTDALGVLLSHIGVVGGSGEVTVRGTAAAGVGVSLADGASISTTTGAINLYGTGANFGLDIADGGIETDSGDILLDGTATAATATAGVRVTGDGLVTNGGNITVTGTSAGGVGVQLGDGGTFAIGSGGGAIVIAGTGIDAGVVMQGNQVASAGGAVNITGTGATTGVSLEGSDIDSAGGGIDIDGMASASGGTGVDLTDAQLRAGAGNVSVLGNAAAGTGISFGGNSGISTTTGGISLTGIGADAGLLIDGGELTTESGHFDLRGRGTGSASNGLVIGQGVSIVTNGGGIELSGEGGSGAGLSIGTGSLVDAGDSLIVFRAANDGSSDAIRLQGAIHSGLGVNLRPGGVDANGGLTDHVDDEILIGGTTGFTLSGTELALIDSPELIIGSNLHAGAIRVLTATSRDGNLTLQNTGGSGGIDLQAAVNVGNGTLALSSGGSITQTSAGAISAHSLLANAGGDVLLAYAQNNVASTTLGGSAGGAFEFQDVDALAIGNVSAIGFDATSGALSSLGANGIDASGDVFVRNLAGDLILNEDVVGNNITLVTAGRLQNLGNAGLIASGDWRVWANTWEGETRGGLAGSGNLPNLYGCAFNGACGVTVPTTDNHFIYVQQPTAVITFDSFSREYGLANPLFTYTVTGAILGDTAANVASGTATSTATIASDVGNYAISGIFTSASGYRFQLVPGTLAITPATLFFTADPSIRYLGSPNPAFTGTVTGFRNGDTVQSVFGSGTIWSSPAGVLSPVGFYPVNGGTSAKNYVFAQAPGNATALQIIPLPQLSSTPIDLIRETVNTYVYDRNFGGAPVCALNASIEDQKLASTGDDLSMEWSKVRSRPNLTNCFETDSKNGCGSF